MRKLIIALLAIALTGSSILTVHAATSRNGAAIWSQSKIHTMALTYAPSDYSKAIADFQRDETKSWINATIVIDGKTFKDVGIRLKGNSSLRNLNAQAIANPQTLPWLVKLDKYKEGQNFEGLTSFVIRSNTSESAMNEAVALALLGKAGLATQRSTFASLSVNKSTAKLRLIIENPDDSWYISVFGDSGLLYKAEADGDYSYRGETTTAYENVFEQENQKKNENLQPLIAFLKFINQSSDEEFYKNLKNYLDVDAFANYLAMQTLVSNFDSIEGPGNNSYLQFNPKNGLMTVVSWDQNLSFGQQNGMGGGGNMGFPPGGRNGAGAPPTLPNGFIPPESATVLNPEGRTIAQGNRPGFAGGIRGRGNILATRFKANKTFSALIEEKLTQQKKALITSKVAESIIATQVKLLTSKGKKLISVATIKNEANRIRTSLKNLG